MTDHTRTNMINISYQNIEKQTTPIRKITQQSKIQNYQIKPSPLMNRRINPNDQNTNYLSRSKTPTNTQVIVRRRVVEPDKTYLNSLQRAVENNERENNRLRSQREALQKENFTLQNKITNIRSTTPTRPVGSDSRGYMRGSFSQNFESNFIGQLEQKNGTLKNEIKNMEVELNRFREMQKNSNSYHDNRIKELNKNLNEMKNENKKLKRNLSNADDKDRKLMELANENQRLKEQLRDGFGDFRGDISLIEENAQLKSQIAGILKELEFKKTIIMRLEKQKMTQPSNENLLKDLRRLNEDNASLYDDNKLLMRENNQLKSQISVLSKKQHTQSPLTPFTQDTTSKKDLDSAKEHIRRLKVELERDHRKWNEERETMLKQIAMRSGNENSSSNKMLIAQKDSVITNLNREVKKLRDELSDISKQNLKLKQDISELRNGSLRKMANPEKESLLKMVSQKDLEIETLTQKLSSMNRRLEKVHGSNENYKQSFEKRIEMMERENKKLITILNEKDEVFKEMDQDIEDLQKENHDLRNMIQNDQSKGERDYLKKELEALRNQLEDADEEIKKLTSQKIQFESEKMELEDKIERLDNQIIHLNQELNIQIRNIEDMEQEKSQIQGQLNSLKDNNQGESEKLRRSLEKKDQIINEMNQDIKKLKSKLENIGNNAQEIENLNREKHDLGHKLSLYEREIEIMKEEIEKKDSDLIQANQMIEREQIKFHDLLKENRTILENINNDDEEKRHLMREVAKKQNKLDMVENELIKLKSDVEKILKENKLLKKKCSTAEADRENLSNQLAVLEKDHIEVQDKKSDLENENIALKRQIKELNQSSNPFEVQVKELEAQIETLEGESRRLKKDHNREIEEREGEHEKQVRRLLQDFEKKMIELADSNDQLQNEAIRYKKKIEDLETMNKNLETMNKDLEEKSQSQEVKEKPIPVVDQTQIEQLKIRINQLFKENSDIRNRGNQMEGVILEYEQNLRIVKGRVEELETENVHLKHNQGSSQEKGVDVKIIQEFKVRLNQLLAENSTLRSNIEENHLVISDYKKDVHSLQNQLSTINLDNGSMIGEYKKRVEDLMEENQEIKKDFNPELVESLKLNIKNLIEENKEIRKESNSEIVSNLKKSVKELRRENKDLFVENEDLKKKTSVDPEMLAGLRERIRALIEENKRVKEEVVDPKIFQALRHKVEELELEKHNKGKNVKNEGNMNIIMEMKKRINGLLKENSELRTSSRMKGGSHQLDILELKIDELKEKNERMKYEAINKNEEFKRRVNSLLQENHKLRETLENLERKDANNYKQKYLIDDLNRSIENLKNEKKHLGDQISDKEKEIKLLNNSRRIDEEEKAELRERIKSQMKQITELESQKSEIVRESLTPEENSSGMVEKLKQENLELVQRINQERSNNLDLKDKIITLENRLTKAAEDVTHKSQQLRDMESMSNLSAVRSRQYKEMTKKARESDILMEKLDNANQQLNEMRDKFMKMERKNMELEEKMEMYKKGHGENLKKSHHGHEDDPRIILLETQIMELRQENNTFKNKIQLLEQENNNLEHLSKQRLTELENLKVKMLTQGDLQNEELHRLRAQFEAYVRQHYDIQEITSRHEMEMRNNQEKISELLQTISHLQEKIKEMRVTLKQRNDYITALEEKNDSRLRETSQMTHDIDNLRRENIDLNSRLSSIKKERDLYRSSSRKMFQSGGMSNLNRSSNKF